MMSECTALVYTAPETKLRNQNGGNEKVLNETLQDVDV